MSCDPIKLIFKEPAVEIKILHSDFLTANTPPSAPTGLQETAVSPTTVDISWNANPEGDIAGYNVYVDGVKNNGSLVNGTTYQITGLSGLTSYSIYITAVDTGGLESDPSSTITSTTTELIPNQYSLDLDGASDYGEVPHAASLQATGEVYIRARVKLIDTGVNFSTTFRTILSKGFHSSQDYSLIVQSQDPNNPTASWIVFILNNSDNQQLRLESGSVGDGVPDAFANNEWHKVEAYANITESKIFVDDVEVASGPGFDVKPKFNNPLYIGWAGSDRYWSGRLDEIQVWDSISDAQANDDKLLDGNENGLMFYANFEQNDGIVNDQSTNNNNGTLQGNANIVQDAPTL